MPNNNDVLRVDENWTSSEVLEKDFPKNPSYAMLERARRILLGFIRELSDIPADGYRGNYEELKHDIWHAAQKLIEIVDLHADAYERELGFKYRVRQMCRKGMQAIQARLAQ